MAGVESVNIAHVEAVLAESRESLTKSAALREMADELADGHQFLAAVMCNGKAQRLAAEASAKLQAVLDQAAS